MSQGQQGSGGQQSPPQQDNKPAGQSAVEAAGAERELSHDEERSALDWLLGAPAPASYYVNMEYDTPQGLKPLRVNFDAIDGSKLDKIEQSNINERTGTMNKAQADAELFIEAVTSIEDPETGKKTIPSSEEFRTIRPDQPPLASSIDALNVRFGKQPGLIAGVASAIREAAGWKADRVGQASRKLVEAAGN